MDKWKKRAQALSKQCTDLSTVMRKYITDSKNKPKEKVAPVRITRSVGLQVMSSEQRRQMGVAGRGGGLLQRRGPGRPPLSVNKPTMRPPATVVSSTLVKPVHNGVVRSTSAVREASPTKTVATPTSGKNWQVGGTTIMVSPAPTMTPATSTTTTTITPQQPRTSPVSIKPKPVIDVVDIDSDEETPVNEPPVPAQPRPQQPPVMSRGMGRPVGAVYGRGRPAGAQPGMVRPRMGLPMRPVQMAGGRGGVRGPARQLTHPAPLPGTPHLANQSPAWKMPPPRPALKISRWG